MNGGEHTFLDSAVSHGTEVSLYCGTGIWAGLSWVALLPPAAPG